MSDNVAVGVCCVGTERGKHYAFGVLDIFISSMTLI